MKQSQTLSALAETVRADYATKRDFLVPSNTLRMEQSLEHGPLMRFGGEQFRPRPNFHRQLGEKLSIPGAYYERMLTTAPELLEKNVNRWLEGSTDTRLVRLIGNQGRAFLSNRYRPLDNFDLVTQVVPKLLSAGLEIVSCEVNETNLYIQGHLPKIQGEVKVGDVVQSGISIRNSEVGCGSLSVQPLIYRLVCLNGMIMPDSGVRRHHVGKRLGDGGENFEELFSNDTKRKIDQAFWAQVNDIVDGTLSQETFAGHLERMQVAAGIKLAKPKEAIEVTQRQFALNQSEADEIMNRLITGADISVWGLANAVTNLANDAETYERAVALEEVGGRIIELPASVWGNN